MQTRRPLSSSFLLLTLLAVAAPTVACTSFEAAEEGTTTPNGPDGGTGQGDGNADGGGPKAGAVTTTPADDELNESFGVFVATRGDDSREGTRERPLRSLKIAIEEGARLGKRVYACTGTYAEAIVLADSVSIIGGLDCADAKAWHTGGAPTRIESASSPVVRGKDITSPTRLEGLDIRALDATTPSASAIGVLADHAPGLTLAKSTVTAGQGAPGADGVEGVQLAKGGSFDGPASRAAALCDGVVCPRLFGSNLFSDGGPGIAQSGTCLGEAGHDGESGGRGGASGMFVYTQFGASTAPITYNNSVPKPGEAKTGAAGTDGADGAVPAAVGTLGPDGYVAEPGKAGTSGMPGKGGAGGDGKGDHLVSGLPAGQVWRAMTGAGGGAGGCPGLAGTAGGGGGASIAIALIESPVVIDTATLVAGGGGRGGAGTFGSSATTGGLGGGTPSYPRPITAAQAGGNGGRSGVSTNGGNGPSFGIFHTGAAPTVTSSNVTVGVGGAALAERQQTDAFGNVHVIPATPAGLVSKIFTP